MTLTKYKLGELIEECTAKNEKLQYGIDDVKGISTGKTFIETKANMEGVSLTSYKIVNRNEFVYVADTSRRGDKIALALNNTFNEILISSIYTVFRIKRENLLLSDYLFMYFNRTQFDRYSRYNSWGSVRELFSWEEMCDIEIDLPPLSIQQKYVNVYKSMVANQQSYERGLEDLKLVCDAFVENIKKNRKSYYKHFLLGELIEQRREKYDGSEIPVRGVSKEGFIEPKQDDADLRMYNQFYYNDFVFNPARMELNSIALNSFFKKACCSSLYEVFYVKKTDIILPEYLNLLIKRSEFARWCEYVGWGSAREYCRVDTISQYPVVVPSIEEQKAVVNIFKAYNTRKSINEKLKKQIKDICPILIKGSIEEAKRTEN